MVDRKQGAKVWRESKNRARRKKIFLSLASSAVISTLLTFYIIIYHLPPLIEIQVDRLQRLDVASHEAHTGSRKMAQAPTKTSKTLAKKPMNTTIEVIHHHPTSAEIQVHTLQRLNVTSHKYSKGSSRLEPALITTNTTMDKKIVRKTVKYAGTCQHWFEPTFEENLKVVSNYRRGKVQDYMLKIGGNMTQPKQILTKFPVLVTAASYAHFNESQGLLKSIHEIVMPKYGDIKIIYYDLGLSKEQRQQLKKYCKCEVRKFPFSDLPEHIKARKTYTWKPVIVKTVLMEYGWVWYMDSSARFITNDLDLPLEYSLKNSLLFFTYGPSLSVAQHTDKRTSAFLGEDMCKYRNMGELEAGFVLYHFDNVTSIVIDQLVACALWQECMAPPGARKRCRRTDKSDGQCHRYDQSVLSIILRRLYHDTNDYPNVKPPFRIHIIRRRESVNYFQDQ